MAVTFRASALTTNTGTNPAAATEPTGAASGDMLVAVALCGAVVSQPSGWTQRFKDTQGGVSWVVSDIPRGASAPSLAWTWTGSAYYEIHIVCLKPGVNTVAFDAVSAAGAKGNSNHAPDPLAVQPVKTTSLCVIGGINFGAIAAWTAATPAGYVIRSVNTGGLDGVLADKSLSTAASENPAAFAPSVSGDWWDGFAATYTDEVSSGTTPPGASELGPRRAPLGRGLGVATLLTCLSVGLLQTTLLSKDQGFGAPGEAKTYDYPNPQLKKVTQPQTWTQQVSQLLKDQVFGAAGESQTYDYPNPTLKKVPQPHTWTQPVSLLLLSRDQLFGAAGESQTYDYPNPRPAKVSPPTWIQARPSYYVESSVQPPFVQTEWPLAMGKIAPLTLQRSWTLARPTYYIDQPTFGPTDWPLPRAAARLVELRTWTANLQESTLAVTAAPFAQTDWPTPATKPALTTLRAWVLGRPTYYVDATPAASWTPLPPAVLRRVVVDWIRGPLATAAAVTPAPFSLTAWPLPGRAARLRDLTWTAARVDRSALSPALAADEFFIVPIADRFAVVTGQGRWFTVDAGSFFRVSGQTYPAPATLGTFDAIFDPAVFGDVVEAHVSNRVFMVDAEGRVFEVFE
jgi:hypothetical protein